MTENLMGEIYLEPEEEIIKNTKDIAEASKSAEKYVFCIIYEASEKSLVLSEMKRMDCEILNQSDAKSCVIVKISMSQLAAIKTLNCIERVEVVEDEAMVCNVETLVLKNTVKNDIMSIETEATEQVSLSANGGVSTMSYSGSSYSNSNTMQTAHYLPLSSWVNGCICCPGAEVWYRFTANVSNASEYIIYSSGSLDVVAYLYDSNGNYITQGDDEAGFPNFSITRQLTYGATYYVKVKAYGSNTGNYNIRVGYTTQSSSGGGSGNSGNSNSDYSNDQSSAIQLILNGWRSDEICCPGADMWYKFTPSTNAYYTIYSSGSLDTVGYLYDANSSQINYNDDAGSGLNFKMVQHLTANQTYYIKVKAYGSNTGYFSVKVSDTVHVGSVTINDEYVTLNKGQTGSLSATVLPTYATNQTLRWESSDTSVVTVESTDSTTCRITAVDRGSACVCAFAQDASGKSSCCEVIVNVPVESVVMDTTTRILHVGQGGRFKATALPENANNRNLRWTSSKQEVASVNSVTGYVTANAVGETNIIATAQDGSGKYGVCVLTVEPPIAVQGIDICCESYTMDVGETTYLSYDIYPSDATNKSVTWCSTNPNVAEVDASTGRIIAKLAGTTIITATTGDGCFVDSCELWVHGKTPVFLIHGRTSNSFYVWGAGNRIFVNPMDTSEADNNHYNSSINALSHGNVQYLYTNKNVQDIFGYQTGQTIKVDGTNVANYTIPGVFNGEFDDGKYTSEHPEGGNLAYYLKSNGYKENINLFVFNYPNEDAVKYSAQKFEAYINNLISYVRTSGSNEMKACFYASRNDYNNNNYKINIVGHSMGGLVARYFIENLYHDNHVDKLITICTPHWGSGYGELSSNTGIQHKLCDHDLDFNSAMYGGSNSTTVNCDKGTCPESNYIVTPALQYQRQRLTKYYAIAGIDYDATYVNLNDHTFEMPTNFTTYQEITDYLVSKNVYKLGGKDSQIKFEPYPESIGDNMVGFLSQIGWVGDNQNTTPEPKIQMHKIFIDVDTNGGNGGETFVWEAIMEWLFDDVLLHSKIPHRIPVIEKTIQFLGE